MSYNYLVTTSIRFPSKEANNIDFRKPEFKKDIEKAVNFYNSSNVEKKIKSIKYSKKIFQFIFSTENECKSIGHNLSLFSRILYNKIGWEKYTSVPSKLFQYQHELHKNGIVNTEEKTNNINIDKNLKTIIIPKNYILEGYTIEFI